MALVLRTGLAAAAASLLIGLGLLVSAGGSLDLGSLAPLANRAAFDPRTVGSELWAGHGGGWLTLGLLLLVATPVARVSFGLYSFHAERDPLLTRAALVVLLLLLVGLFALGPLLR
ncbi:MAG: DUF1634 domain-containing protein [Thermoplasmata archaeon]|nr:DUF1634 domain-containing protein [Thermoplasmata archaeon]